jgi:hypothetical protein
VVPLKGEFLLNEKVIKFAYSLDKSDDSLWNITDGSPKIKNFKEHLSISWVLFIEKCLQVSPYLSLALLFK